MSAHRDKTAATRRRRVVKICPKRSECLQVFCWMITVSAALNKLDPKSGDEIFMGEVIALWERRSSANLFMGPLVIGV